MKPWYRSLTILVNLALLGVGLIWPKLAGQVCGSEAITLQVLAVINLLLRLKTSEGVFVKPPTDKIILGLCALILVGCGSVPQKLDLDVVWKKDLPYCIEGVGCYEGVSVVPHRSEYSIEIEPKGNADIDLVIFNSCHREEAFERTSSGWFVFKQKKRFKFFYKPVPNLETRRDCDLKANTFDEDEGKHSWMIMRVEHPYYTLPARVACNGSYRNFNGVSACQSKVGLIQRVEFDGIVEFATPKEGCGVPVAKDGGFEWRMSKGECIYIIRDASDRRHSMLTYGYQGVPIRREE